MVPKVSCCAVGESVHWDMYQTPMWTPTGGMPFDASILVPRSARRLDVEARLVAYLGGWGPIEARRADTLDLVFKKA